MKKLIKKLIHYTNEIHWFVFGALGYILYKEIMLNRPYGFIDVIAIPFFGLIIGVPLYRWLSQKFL